MNSDGTVDAQDGIEAAIAYRDWRATHRALASNPESRHVFFSGYYAALRGVVSHTVPLEMLPGIGYFKSEDIVATKPMGGD